MQLEWFREHKMFVYWVLLPVTVVTMAIWGIGGSGKMFGGSGPAVRYTLGKNEYSMSPSEVFDYRLKMSKYLRRGGPIRSVDVGEHVLEVSTARAAGFETGTEEMRQVLRNAVKQQIQQRESNAPPKVDEEIYGKLLNAMQISANDFEQVTHELALRGKYQQFAMDYHVGDGELFADYCREKQVVRIRYQEFKSPDYLSKVPQPTADKIKEFYNKNKDTKAEDLKNVLFTQPTLGAELIGFDTEKYLASLKPSEDDLKAFYERRKAIDWLEKPANPPKAGEAPEPPKYKPYDAVKAEVETKWRDEKKFQATSELGTIKAELEKAEQQWNDEQGKKPEAERKPFSTQEWVKKKDLPYLLYWTTPEQTQEVYKKGKKEMKATDAEWVKDIFFWAHVPDMAGRGDTDKYKDWFKKQFEGWTQPNMIDPAKVEKGMVIAHKTSYTDAKPKTLEDATPAIIERLKVLDAVDLANKDAQKAHDDWENGKDLPKLDDMLEIKADSTKQTSPIARKYFESPKGIGEVLAIAEGPAEQATPDNPTPSPSRIFYVGFPVEIQLPTNITFEKDTQWDREEKRREIADSYSQYISSTMQESMGRKVSVPAGVKDPPLYDSYGRGDE